jgi:RNase_H superfamily
VPILAPGKSVCNLPAGDLLDEPAGLSGLVFEAAVGGTVHLFGYSFLDDASQERYVGCWALSRAQERAAFEQFIDFAMNRLNAYPDLHIYHFAPYEPAALKRLMGRYATREEELDQLLRGKRFVDLFAVVRQGIRASVESYSIKRLEPLYGYERDASLNDANQALFKVQAHLELGDVEGIAQSDRSVVEAYNRDDCQSTWRLRDWLETVRAAAVADGATIARPNLLDAEPSEALSEWQLKIAALVDRLAKGVPDEPSERTADEHGRWILAHCLDWHRAMTRMSDSLNGCSTPVPIDPTWFRGQEVADQRANDFRLLARQILIAAMIDRPIA